MFSVARGRQETFKLVTATAQQQEAIAKAEAPKLKLEQAERDTDSAMAQLVATTSETRRALVGRSSYD